MIDGHKLKQQHSLAVLFCIGSSLVPLLLMQVALQLAVSGNWTASAGPLQLVLFGLLALAPLVSVPLIRRMGLSAISDATGRGEAIEQTLMIWSVTEYALWEISSLAGFIAFVQGAPVPFMLACVALSYAGFVISFPRRSRWVSVCADLESMAVGST